GPRRRSRDRGRRAPIRGLGAVARGEARGASPARRGHGTTGPGPAGGTRPPGRIDGSNARRRSGVLPGGGGGGGAGRPHGPFGPGVGGGQTGRSVTAGRLSTGPAPATAGRRSRR